MPLENLHAEKNHIWALWNIVENESQLTEQVFPEQLPGLITNPVKRLEYLAGRATIKALLAHWNVPFAGLTKDEFGKPFLKNVEFHVSLSHSYPYVAAIVHRTKPVGIDLEQPKDKLLKIAPRILSKSELHDAGTDVVKHCIYWCAKETLIKIHGKKNLTLSENLRIEPFLREKQGNLIGEIIAADSSITIPLDYIVFENFVLVLNQ